MCRVARLETWRTVVLAIVVPFLIQSCTFDTRGLPALPTDGFQWQCGVVQSWCPALLNPVDVKILHEFGGTLQGPFSGLCVWEPVGKPQMPYIDRPLYIDYAPGLVGCSWLQTSQDQWNDNSSKFASFILNSDVEDVFIATEYDRSWAPNWLLGTSNWNPQWEMVTEPFPGMTEGSPFVMISHTGDAPGPDLLLHLWKYKHLGDVVKAGEQIIIPGNSCDPPVRNGVSDPASNMYFVILKPVQNPDESKKVISYSQPAPTVCVRNGGSANDAADETRKKQPLLWEYENWDGQWRQEPALPGFWKYEIPAGSCKETDDACFTFMSYRGKGLKFSGYKRVEALLPQPRRGPVSWPGHMSKIIFDPSSSVKVDVHKTGSDTSSFDSKVTEGYLYFDFDYKSRSIAMKIMKLRIEDREVEPLGLIERIVIVLTSPCVAACQSANPLDLKPCSNYEIAPNQLECVLSFTAGDKRLTVQSLGNPVIPISVDPDPSKRSFQMDLVFQTAVKYNGNIYPVDVSLDIKGTFVNIVPEAVAQVEGGYSECVEGGNKGDIWLESQKSIFAYDTFQNPAQYEWYKFFGMSEQMLLGTGKTLQIPSHTLGLGTHTFTLVLRDTSGIVSTDDVVVHVRDTTPPTLTIPADKVTPLLPKGTASAYVDIGQAKATDICWHDLVRITNDAPKGYRFPPGTSVVTWTAEDCGGNTTSKYQKIKVRVRCTTSGDCAGEGLRACVHGECERLHPEPRRK